MTRTIVELDLTGFSDLARVLEENLSVEVVALLNEQIQDFVDAGLKAVKIPRGRAVLGTAGDNAFVVFDQAGQGHRFARAVYEAARAHNASKTVASARRWFRIGAATGEICFSKKRGKSTVAGITIANAVRLEAAAKPGEFLVDLPTFQALPRSLQREYGPEETVQGKRDEQFQARRCVMLEGAPAPAPAKPPAAKARASQVRGSGKRSRNVFQRKAGAVTIKIRKLTGQNVGTQIIQGDQHNDFRGR